MILDPSPEIVKDKTFGYGVAEGRLSAFATGYFIWVRLAGDLLIVYHGEWADEAYRIPLIRTLSSRPSTLILKDWASLLMGSDAGWPSCSP